jgi:type II secretory pathway pseudopilin PulG
MDAAPPPITTPEPEPKTDGKAIGSLILGILSLLCFSFLTGIPAIILGHISRSSIRQSMGRLKGEGMALAGLIMGYISVTIIPVILIIAAIAIPALLRSRQTANESAAVANLRTINTAEVTYRSSAGGQYGEIDDLIRTGLLDETFYGVKAGYGFDVIADASSYTAEARPATNNTGRYAFFTTADSVIRYADDQSLAPTGRAGKPVE